MASSSQRHLRMGKLLLYLPSVTFIYITWMGCIAIEDFTTILQAGMDKGAFIRHRIHCSSVDIDKSRKRAAVKMKVTITQRFKLLPGDVLVDAESGCW